MLHLAIPVIFGLGFIEDRECSCDDQAQFLEESQTHYSTHLIQSKYTILKSSN